MRKVVVNSECDICGKLGTSDAVFLEFHSSYADTLPEGWGYFDNVEFPWIEFSGDQCAECQESFLIYVNAWFGAWKKFRITDNFENFTNRTND